MKHFESEDWTQMHVPTWLEHLAPLLDGKEHHALEIGAYEGRTSCWLMENMLQHPASTLTCVDTWDGRHDVEGLRTKHAESLFDANMKEWFGKVFKEKQNSLTALSQMVCDVRKFDFIYVDGCHEGLTVLSDLLLSWMLLEDGGFMVADDMRWHGKGINVPPGKAWRCFFAMRPPGLQVVHLFRQAIARKVLK